MRTVQAPQSPASQPTLTPVSPRLSRNNFERRVVGETQVVSLLPFIAKVIEAWMVLRGEIIVATSGTPNAGVECSADQRQGRIVAVNGSCTDVIDRGELRKV